MLHVAGASVAFDGSPALAGVDLEVGAGEVVAVLGPSGSGKTTLLRAIAGLQVLDDGVIRWDGEDVTGTPAHERGFGLVFQDFALFPHLDVGGNVAFGLRMSGLPAAQRAPLVQRALGLVDLEGYETRSTATLSGGEAQRVALARALVVEPRMLLLDEPLGSLDQALRQRLAQELRDLLERLEISALHVTHDQDEAFAVADRVAVLAEGRVLQMGSPEELWHHPVSERVARFLGFETILDAIVDNGIAQTVLGPIATPGLESGRVRLVVRPEAIAIDERGPIEATVLGTRFRGADYRVELGVGGHTVVAITHRPPSGRVGITVDPNGVSLVP